MVSRTLTEVEREVRSIQGCLEKLAGKTAVLRGHVLAGEVLPAMMCRSAGRLAVVVLRDLDGALAPPPRAPVVAESAIPQEAPAAAPAPAPAPGCPFAAPPIAVRPVCPGKRIRWASVRTTAPCPAAGGQRPAVSSPVAPAIDLCSGVEHTESATFEDPAAPAPGAAPASVIDLWSGVERGADRAVNARVPAVSEPAPEPPPAAGAPASAPAAALVAEVAAPAAALPAAEPVSQTAEAPVPAAPATASSMAAGNRRKMPKRKPAPLRTLGEQLLREGVHDAEVARQCKVSREAVGQWREKLGLPSSPGAGPTAPPQQGEELLRAGQIDAEVARQCGVSPRTVAQWREKLGLPPSPGPKSRSGAPRASTSDAQVGSPVEDKPAPAPGQCERCGKPSGKRKHCNTCRGRDARQRAEGGRHGQAEGTAAHAS